MFIGMIFSTFHLFCECPLAYYSEVSEVTLWHLAERLMPDHSVSSQGLRFHTRVFYTASSFSSKTSLFWHGRKEFSIYNFSRPGAKDRKYIMVGLQFFPIQSFERDVSSDSLRYVLYRVVTSPPPTSFSFTVLVAMYCLWEKQEKESQSFSVSLNSPTEPRERLKIK